MGAAKNWICKINKAVIPAKAGIQGYQQKPQYFALDSRFRGNDDFIVCVEPD